MRALTGTETRKNMKKQHQEQEQQRHLSEWCCENQHILKMQLCKMQISLIETKEGLCSLAIEAKIRIIKTFMKIN